MFPYRKLDRHPINGVRHYMCPITGKLVPSVTTILGATGDKTHLENWYKRLGETRANAIRDESAQIGTMIHHHLEKYLLGTPSKPNGNPYNNSSLKLANIVVEKGLVGRLDKLWAAEASLFYPGLYAGTTDGAGIYEGEETIIDFKNTKTRKKEEWVQDYYLQVTAYAMAHNELFGTNIRKGIILMVNRITSEYQEFPFDITPELENKWIARLEDYFTNHSVIKD